VEDLMREHGVLRRAILVFRESASRLREGTGQVDANALAKRRVCSAALARTITSANWKRPISFRGCAKMAARPPPMWIS
jgi:hypothetical protein